MPVVHYFYVYPCSRTVIGVGLEEEDRIDQWIEDAESVSVQQAVFVSSLQTICMVCINN